MTAIIVITFNCPEYLQIQYDAFKKFAQFKFEFIVCDNSDDENAERIRSICSKNHIFYCQNKTEEKDFSISNALGLNLAWNVFHNNVDYIFFADHDLFPFKRFELKSKYDLVGLKQIRKHINYLWNGCLMIDTNIVSQMDFMPGEDNGVRYDTGGKMAKLLSELGGNVFYISEDKFKNDDGYEYSVLDETFLHIVNGSNWKEDEGHKKRIDSILKTLKEISK